MTKLQSKLIMISISLSVVLGVLAYAINSTSNDCPPVNQSCKACSGSGYTNPNAIYDCPVLDNGKRIKTALLTTLVSLPILLLLAVVSTSRLSKK